MKLNTLGLYGKGLGVWSLLTLFSGAAAAGPTSTGGGASVVCADSVEFYDLYEGRILYNREPREVQGDPWDFVQSQIDRMPSFTDRTIFEHSFKTIREAYSLLPAGVSLDKPEDLGTQVARVVPTGCHLEALGYFESSGDLRVSRDLLKRMSNTDIAAFLLHETLYLAARNSVREKDSYRTRLAVSEVFDRDLKEESFEAISELLRTTRGETIYARLPLASPGARVSLIRAEGARDNPSSFHLDCFDSRFETSLPSIFWGDFEIPDRCVYLSFRDRGEALGFVVTGSNGRVIFDSRTDLPSAPETQYSQSVYLMKNY